MWESGAGRFDSGMQKNVRGLLSLSAYGIIEAIESIFDSIQHKGETMGFSIGEAVCPLGLSLGPMAGYSDHAMRTVCHREGAEYAVSEMVSAKAICYGDKKTAPLARIFEGEGPVAIQIFGSEPVFMAEAARRIEEGFAGGLQPVAIDINMGCPVHKIVSNREGSALMRQPSLVCKIVEAVRMAVSLPVSVKIRAGWDEHERNAVEVAHACEAGGASLLTVHGRTRAQMYAGEADYAVIADVAGAVSIPVIGNGDVRGIDACRRLLDDCGCAGVMVARGAVGNPFIFGELRAALLGEVYEPPTLARRLSVAREQVLLASEEKGEAVAVRESRKQLAAYLHGRRGAASLRALINSAESMAEIDSLLERALEQEG